MLAHLPPITSIGGLNFVYTRRHLSNESERKPAAAINPLISYQTCIGNGKRISGLRLAATMMLPFRQLPHRQPPGESGVSGAALVVLHSHEPGTLIAEDPRSSPR